MKVKLYNTVIDPQDKTKIEIKEVKRYPDTPYKKAYLVVCIPGETDTVNVIQTNYSSTDALSRKLATSFFCLTQGIDATISNESSATEWDGIVRFNLLDKDMPVLSVGFVIDNNNVQEHMNERQLNEVLQSSYSLFSSVQFFCGTRSFNL